MNSKVNDVNVYATYRDIFHWWIVFVALDAVIWAVFMSLHSAYIAGPPQRGTFSIAGLLGHTLLGLVGKMMLHSPYIFLSACIFRKRLLLRMRYWFVLPVFSYFFGLSVVLVPQIIFDGVSMHRLLIEFTSYRNGSHMMIPMALVSTIFATIPWAIFLERRFRDLKR